MNKLFSILILLFVLVLTKQSNAQFSVDYLSPKQYTVAGIMIDGVTNFDHSQIIIKSGLKRGSKITIPGDDIAQAIKKLWDENQLLLDFRTMKFLPEICKKCKYVSVCRGGCRASAQGYFGKLNAIDPLMKNE